MVSVSGAIAHRMQHALSTVATVQARTSGYCQRTSKLTAEVFCTTLVLGWMQHPDATMAQLAQVAALQGVPISPQGLQERFTPGAARLLLAVLGALLDDTEPGEQSCPVTLLERYSQVIIEDSSSISLPDDLQTVWRGCGGRTGGHAAANLQVQLDLRCGQLYGPWITPGRTPDRASPGGTRQAPSGSMRIADLGYFSLDRLTAEHQAGCFWLTRLHPQTSIRPADGIPRRGETVADFLATGPDGPQEFMVELGVCHRLPCRLIAIPRPPDVVARQRERLRLRGRHKHQNASPKTLALAAWDLFVTNDLTLTRAEILTLHRARWQIEILWRLWKSEGRLTRWRTRTPWRILCELYAKLIGLVILHRILARGTWQRPGRSFVQATRMIRNHAAQFVLELHSLRRLSRTLTALLTALPASVPVVSHPARPATYQRLRAPADVA
jgi:Transposase DDE domain